jgi:hypothetical protein
MPIYTPYSQQVRPASIPGFTRPRNEVPVVLLLPELCHLLFADSASLACNTPINVGLARLSAITVRMWCMPVFAHVGLLNLEPQAWWLLLVGQSLGQVGEADAADQS